jgi:glyoxylase-like metal-dependent hydrolase (beta-lactamase superfamily II)
VKVTDDLCVLPVSIELPGRTMVMNMSLILDAEHGPTLVDAGMPGEENSVQMALAEHGFSLTDLKRIIVTHQDVDHIGALSAIKAISGATVYAHPIEAPYIEGKTKLVKYPTDEALAQNPRMQELFGRLQYTEVDELVEDGDRLDLAGGVHVIYTPGHAPGHICLFLERSKALITGDALTATDGQLNGPNPGATPDMTQAIESVKKLAEIDEIRAIVAYHGGLVTDDPLGQLRRLAAGLTPS